LTCFAAVKNFSGAVAIRFLLGVCEAAVTPGFALITSQWYTKKEQVHSSFVKHMLSRKLILGFE